MAIGFRGLKFPAARGLQSEIGEKLAGAGRIEIRRGYVSGRIDVNPHHYADFSVNGVAGLLRNVGKNLIEDFTAR